LAELALGQGAEVVGGFAEEVPAGAQWPVGDFAGGVFHHLAGQDGAAGGAGAALAAVRGSGAAAAGDEREHAPRPDTFERGPAAADAVSEVAERHGGSQRVEGRTEMVSARRRVGLKQGSACGFARDRKRIPARKLLD